LVLLFLYSLLVRSIPLLCAQRAASGAESCRELAVQPWDGKTLGSESSSWQLTLSGCCVVQHLLSLSSRC